MKLHFGEAKLSYCYYNLMLKQEHEAYVYLYGISFGRVFIGVSIREIFKTKEASISGKEGV